jgi:hypothetical protein
MTTPKFPLIRTLSFNAAWVGATFLLFTFVARQIEGSVVLIVCYLAAALALVLGIRKAMAGDRLQIAATPVTAGLLLSIIAATRPHENGVVILGFVFLIATTFGICICTDLISCRSLGLRITLGIVAGVIGFGLTLWFIQLEIPVFKSFYSPNEFMAANLVGNLVPGITSFAEKHHLGIYFFIGQSIVLAAWNAILFGIPTFLVGLLICSPFMKEGQ